MTRTETVVAEVERPGSTRKSIAAAYRAAIGMAIIGDDFIDWPTVNRAILKRYAPSGLIYIKRRAWRH